MNGLMADILATFFLVVLLLLVSLNEFVNLFRKNKKNIMSGDGY